MKYRITYECDFCNAMRVTDEEIHPEERCRKCFIGVLMFRERELVENDD